MADNKYEGFSKEAIRQLKKLEAEQERFENKVKKYENAKKDRRLKEYKDYKKTVAEREKEYKKLFQEEKNRLAFSKQLTKENANFSKSLAKLSVDTRSLLGVEKDRNTQNSAFASLGFTLAEMKAKEVNLEGDALEKAVEKRLILEEQLSAQQSQAQAVVRAKKEEDELSQFDEQRLYYESLRAELGDKIVDQLIASNRATENNFKQEKRILELKKQQDNLVNKLPQGIQDTIGFVKDLGLAIKAGMGPLFLIGGVLTLAAKSFLDLENNAEDFRKTTGLTNSQMKEIRSQANQITQEFADLGLESKDVFDTIAALKSEFGDISNFSKEVVSGLSVLSTNFGVTAETAGKVQGVLEQIGGLSSETATSLQLQVANMANLAGVAPAKIMEDIAESAEAASTLFRGDVKALAQSAIQARRLGTNLKSVVDTTEKLLDFESGITAELEAAAFVGGQFNLTRARGLAAAGMEVEAQQEILDQIQRSGDFREQNYFTQKALANAAGMEVGEINKLLTNREKLNSLSSEQRKLADDAIKQGLDISNINKEDLATQVELFSTQQEQQKVLDKISNQFTGIASTVGSVLLPLLDAVLLVLAPIQYTVDAIQAVFGAIGTVISKLIGPLGEVGKVMKSIAGAAIVAAAYKSFFAMGNPILGGIAAAAVLTAGFATLSKIGDLNSPANGRTIVSTKEGGLFELSPNDDLVAAPGVSQLVQTVTENRNASTPQNNVVVESSDKTDKLISTIERLEKAYMRGAQVNLDGQKVIRGLGRVGNETTQNNFSLV